MNDDDDYFWSWVTTAQAPVGSPTWSISKSAGSAFARRAAVTIEIPEPRGWSSTEDLVMRVLKFVAERLVANDMSLPRVLAEDGIQMRVDVR